MADPTDSRVMLRAEARARELKRYFTGKPCKNGHLSERQTGSGTCIACHEALKAKAARERPERAREYRTRSAEKHREKRRAKAREYEKTERSKQTQKAWREKNRDKLRQQGRERYERRAEELRAKRREWVAANPESAKATRKKAYRKRHARPDVKLSHSISGGVRRYLRTGKAGRKTWDILPYRPEDLMRHLERQFQPGMTWDNYGEWHVDHIIPISAFNFETAEHADFHRAWALTNLQPMWGRENQSKSAKISAPFQPSLAL